MEEHLEQQQKQEGMKLSHLVVLISFSFFTVLLTGETLLMQWETWMIPLMLFCLAAAWILHIMQILPEENRLWLYTSMMMGMFFFYGTHITSTFDLAPLMAVVLMIFSMAGEAGLVYFGMAAYYVTMFYSVVLSMSAGLVPDKLIVSRTIFHLVLVFMAGCISRVIIFKQKSDEKKYTQRIGELEEINQRTEDFLANVSHELRTPINAVTGITAVMLKREKNEGSREQIRSVQDAGRRLYETIGDILDYTEIDADSVSVAFESFSISSLVTDLIVDNHSVFEEATCEVIFDVDPKVPASLVGDGDKIKKILRHLVTNAVKFCREGGVYIRIYTLKKSYGVNLCLEVRDTGIGMSREEKARITESFYQADSGRNRAAGGLGLGLSIVNGLTKAMNGFMQIESEKGKGTRIRLSIPQSVGDPAPCMSVDQDNELCIGCFLKPDKYEVPEVRDFYTDVITHMVMGLEIPLHRVGTASDLEKLLTVYRISHLFVGSEEYEENTDFLENVDEQVTVLVVAGKGFVPRTRSRVKVIRKPLSGFPIALFLNAKEEITEYDAAAERQMFCPGVRALVTDDEAMNLMVAEGILRDYGMTVRTVTSGEETLRVCEEEDFDIIFLDHMMPGLDGVETMKRLRSQKKNNNKNQIIVALTANAMSGAREMFLSEGFDGFIPKPVELPELERVLKRVLPPSLIDYAETERILTDERDEAFNVLEAYGIDTKAGMNYCGNDKGFYRELLAKFSGDMQQKSSEIREFYGKGDWGNYRIRVHSLKSTAKMIGADRLSELARKAEDAARNGDVPYIQSHEKELLEAYEEMAGNIALGTAGKEESNAEEQKEMDASGLLTKLSMLRESLATFEAEKAQTLAGELSAFTYRGEPFVKRMQDISTLINDFELAAAAEKTGKLISSLQEESQ